MTKFMIAFARALFAVLLAGLATAQTSSPQSSAISRISAPIDDSVRVRLAQSTHPLAKARFDAGPVEANTPMQRMILVLKPSPDQEAQLQTFLENQQTKGSPDYHHWLTPSEFGARFGPSQQDMQQVIVWLHQQGFVVNQVAQSGRWIEFSGVARLVQAAFQTQMRQYQIAGRMHVANSSDISIPAALTPVVHGVVSLHNFVKKPMHSHFFQVHRNAQGILAPVRPDVTVQGQNAAFHFLAPGDFAKIYNLGPLYNASLNGTNQTIAIVARSNINARDYAAFRQTFKLPSNPPQVIVNGQDPGEDFIFADGVEAALDTQWSAAVAPQATMEVVVSGSTLTTDGVDLSASFIVENNLAPIMSVSFGDCEQNLGAQENAFFNSLWQQAAAQGISVFVSTGDNGPAGCDDPNPNPLPSSGIVGVSGMASTPFNTAVGGTEFNENGHDASFWNSTNSPADFSSAIKYIPETVWNESCTPGQANSDCSGQSFFELFASSGGASTLYAKPSWQKTSITGVPNDSARDLPDISLTAAGHDGYLICFTTPDPTTSTDCESNVDINGNPILLNAGVVGGTSASTPAFAGIMAIIDQKAGGRQGLANYGLYSLAAGENFSNCNSSNPSSSCIFNDITTGNNSVPFLGGFNATAGFDLTTGLGSVNANNLVNAWPTGLTATVTSITTSMGATVNITHGQPITLTGQVQKSPTGSGPTGTLAFVTDQPGPQGGFLTVGAGNLAGSPAAFSASFNNLPGGTYNLSAHYPGDGTFAASDSAGIPVNVAKENSIATLQAKIINVNSGILPTSTPVAYGDINTFIIFDSTVAGASGFGFPAGTVNFSDGANVVASGVPLSIGGAAVPNASQVEVANCFTPFNCLTVGTHNITSNYPNGDNSFNASGPSNAVSITITKGNPSIAVNPSPSVAGGVQAFVGATITTGLGSILPTGTVQFFDGGAPIGAPATVNGTGASAQVTFNSSGTHNVTAQYSGDSTYNGASSTVQAINVVAPFTFAGVNGMTTAVVMAGGTATYNLVLLQFAGTNFTGTVAISCTGAPAGTTCSTNPPSASAANGGTPVMVSVVTTTSARLRPSPFKTWSPLFAGAVGILVCGAGRKRKLAVLAVLSVLLMVGITSCGGGGGGGGGNNFRQPTVATLTVTGTSGGFSNSINLNLTITH